MGSYKPSEIALAALLNSVDRLGSHTRQIHFPFNCNFVDMHSPAVRACRERLSLIYAQANEQGGVDEAAAAAAADATPAKAEEPPEPRQLERTISPVSVMSPCESDGDLNNTTKTTTTTANYGCSTTSQQQQHQQSFHSTAAYDNNMDTDDGYFFDETEVEYRM